MFYAVISIHSVNLIKSINIIEFLKTENAVFWKTYYGDDDNDAKPINFI